MDPALPQPGLEVAATPDRPSPRHRRSIAEDRRARGVRTARVTKTLVAAIFSAVFVCTPEVVTAMTQGFTTIFAGQGIEDVAPAPVPAPRPQP